MSDRNPAGTSWTHSARVSARPTTWRAVTSPSTTDGQKIKSSGLPTSWPSWCATGSRRSLPLAVWQQRRVARAASPTTPVVFGIGGDPVSLGLVARLNQPGGNVTGVTFLNTELGRKRLAILQELVPEASRLAVLVNRNSPAAETTIADVKSSGRQVDTLYATNSAEIDAAFASLKQKPADALVVAPDVLFANNRKQTVALAAAQRIPAIYGARDFPDIGGLMSYGDNRSEVISPARDLYRPNPQWREAGRFAGDAGGEIRVHHQSADGDFARHQNSTDAARVRQ